MAQGFPPDLQSIFDRLWAAELRAHREALASRLATIKGDLVGRGALHSSATTKLFKAAFREDLRARLSTILNTLKRILQETGYRVDEQIAEAIRRDLLVVAEGQTLELATQLANDLSKLSLGGGDLAVQDEWPSARDTLLAEFDLFVRAASTRASLNASTTAVTGWPKVDRQVEEMRSRLRDATREEQFQAVGLICREVLISLAQEAYDPSRHQSSEGAQPSNSDARRLLDSFFESELAGSANEEARAHAKSAIRLAVALQHKRTAEARTAALCAEATLSVVSMVAILAGRR